MALINCLDCGAAVSSEAEKCLRCGRPVKLSLEPQDNYCVLCKENGADIRLERRKSEDASNVIGCSTVALGIVGVLALFGSFPLGVVLIVAAILIYSFSRKNVTILDFCPKCHRSFSVSDK